MWCCLYFAIIFFPVALAKHGFGTTDQDWGFVTVREKAHMFWWLHYTTAKVEKYTDKPLIIWLQGGPGSSSTGYGNFAELGPFDLSLEPRNSTWIQWANVLFVDNPVGVGFGYVDSSDAYVQNNTQIGKDFLVFLKQFFESVPEFKTVPLYIFCESYGGKMTAEIALVIDKAVKNGDIQANLKGVGLGDSWISPVDSILTYAPYLLTLGQIDQQGYNLIMEVANKLKSAVDQNDMTTAMDLWDSIDFNINSLTHTDFYNVLTMAPSDSSNTLKKFGPIRSYNLKEELDLGIIMNRGVAPALNISREWVNQNDNVYNWLADDFLNPVTEVVEKLLNETDLTVAVYNGQLDLIVSTLGTLNWVKNLHFNGKDSWDATSKVGFAVDGYYQGYVKKHGNFALYWVDRAGHMVPRDNPSAMYYILKDVTNNFEV